MRKVSMRTHLRLLVAVALLFPLTSYATVSWLQGVSAVDPLNLPSTGIIIDNTGCLNIRDASGASVGVVCLDGSDDLQIGDATGVNNLDFTAANNGVFTFLSSGTPTASAIIFRVGTGDDASRFTIDEDGDTFQDGKADADRFTASEAISISAGLSTSYAKTRLAIAGNTAYIIQTNNAATDAAVFDISIIAQAAGASSTSNLDGANLNFTGGAGASGSAGDADGGNILQTGGAAFGTGSGGTYTWLTPGTPDADAIIATWGTGDDSARMTLDEDGDLDLDGGITTRGAVAFDSNAANTVAIATLENTAGDCQIFRVDATPEAAVTGSICDLALDGTGGVMYIKNTGTATNTGWQAFAETEAFSSLWYHGPAVALTITTQDTFTKVTTFVNEGPEDSGGNVVGDATTDDDITVNVAGTFEMSVGLSVTNDGGGSAEFHMGAKVIYGTPKTITDATNATPIVITTSAAHGLKTGDHAIQTNVGGNTAANGSFAITFVSSTAYSLQTLDHVDVAGNGAYTSGGTVDAAVPGEFFIEQSVSNTLLGRGFAKGRFVLAVGDIIEATVVNSVGTDNLSVSQILLSVDKEGI